MDLNTTAFRIVKSLTDDKKGSKRTLAARAAGLVGGKARAAKLSKERQKEIAVHANQSRWGRAGQK